MATEANGEYDLVVIGGGTSALLLLVVPADGEEVGQPVRAYRRRCRRPTRPLALCLHRSGYGTSAFHAFSQQD
jgi:hypothetical protein